MFFCESVQLLQLIGNVLSFIGSLVLVYPAFRASKILKISHDIKILADKEDNENSFDKAILKTAKNLSEKAGEWTRWNHALLMIGILFIVASGVLSLNDTLCR